MPRRRVVRQSSKFGIVGALVLLLAACSAPAAQAPTAVPANRQKSGRTRPKRRRQLRKRPHPQPSPGLMRSGRRSLTRPRTRRSRSTDDPPPEGTQIADAVKKDTGLTVEFVAAPGVRCSPVSRKRASRVVQQPISTKVRSHGLQTLSAKDTSSKSRTCRFRRLKASTWIVDPYYMSPNGNYLATRFSDSENHIALNTKVIPLSDAPKSWQEYANDPKYVGKISWVDPNTTQDIGAIWTRHGYVGKGMKIEDLVECLQQAETPTLSEPG